MKKNILVILPCISQANGISAYALNYYKRLDFNKIHMDFVVMKTSETDSYIEFEKNGSKVFELIKNNKSIIQYLKTIDTFFKENSFKYDIVHCHVYNYGAIVLYFAKKYGIKTRILHSHATISSDVFHHRIVNSFLIPIARVCATTYFACSNLAGKFLFKNKKFKIINNAVEKNNYKFDNRCREEIRRELNIDNELVIGNVGRLCNQKNQLFLLKVFKEILKVRENAKLLIIGNGSLESKLKNFVKENNMEKNVIFLGVRTDVDKLYNAMDIFCLTSLYEGLPVVGIEAQFNGLPCVFSKTITDEVKISDNVEFIELQNNEKEWCKEILKYSNIKRNKNYLNKNAEMFDIERECINLQNIYLENKY